MKKIIFVILIIVTASNLSFSQFNSNLSGEFTTLIKPAAPTTKLSLGVHGGFAFGKPGVGLAVGLMADIKVQNLSVSPQANFWKIKDDNNFEMACLLRYHLESKVVVPYFDAGIGVNFLNTKYNTVNGVTDNFIGVGLNLGGGIEFLNVGTNYNIFVDGKYKIIIRDAGNVSVYTLTGGIKFLL